MCSTIVRTCVRVKQYSAGNVARFGGVTVGETHDCLHVAARTGARAARRTRMPERARTVPLIPLDDAVVLPNMALAVALASDEARAAVDDALSADGAAHVVLVPRRDGRFARIGVVAELDGHPAMLPGGARGITIRALHRAVLGRADAAGQALRIEVDERPDAPEASTRAHE